jgi:hypothetical protein
MLYNSIIHKQRKRSNKCRGSVFRTEYKLAFGLQVVERDLISSSPVTANCCFFFHFGREKRPTASVSRKSEMQTAMLNPSKPPGGQISLSSTSLVDDLQREFLSCMSCVNSESSLSEQLAEHGPTTGFDDAWRPVGLRSHLLR